MGLFFERLQISSAANLQVSRECCTSGVSRVKIVFLWCMESLAEEHGGSEDSGACAAANDQPAIRRCIVELASARK